MDVRNSLKNYGEVSDPVWIGYTGGDGQGDRGIGLYESGSGTDDCQEECGILKDGRDMITLIYISCAGGDRPTKNMISINKKII